MDTEKKHYTAGIACQVDQEEGPSSPSPTACNSGHVIDHVQLNYCIYVRWRIDCVVLCLDHSIKDCILAATISKSTSQQTWPNSSRPWEDHSDSDPEIKWKVVFVLLEAI